MYSHEQDKLDKICLNGEIDRLRNELAMQQIRSRRNEMRLDRNSRSEKESIEREYSRSVQEKDYYIDNLYHRHREEINQIEENNETIINELNREIGMKHEKLIEQEIENSQKIEDIMNKAMDERAMLYDRLAEFQRLIDKIKLDNMINQGEYLKITSILFMEIMKYHSVEKEATIIKEKQLKLLDMYFKILTLYERTINEYVYDEMRNVCSLFIESIDDLHSSLDKCSSVPIEDRVAIHSSLRSIRRSITNVKDVVSFLIRKVDIIESDSILLHNSIDILRMYLLDIPIIRTDQTMIMIQYSLEVIGKINMNGLENISKIQLKSFTSNMEQLVLPQIEKPMKYEIDTDKSRLKSLQYEVPIESSEGSSLSFDIETTDFIRKMEEERIEFETKWENMKRKNERDSIVRKMELDDKANRMKLKKEKIHQSDQLRIQKEKYDKEKESIKRRDQKKMISLENKGKDSDKKFLRELKKLEERNNRIMSSKISSTDKDEKKVSLFAQIRNTLLCTEDSIEELQLYSSSDCDHNCEGNLEILISHFNSLYSLLEEIEEEKNIKSIDYIRDLIINFDNDDKQKKVEELSSHFDSLKHNIFTFLDSLYSS